MRQPTKFGPYDVLIFGVQLASTNKRIHKIGNNLIQSVFGRIYREHFKTLRQSSQIQTCNIESYASEYMLLACLYLLY